MQARQFILLLIINFVYRVDLKLDSKMNEYKNELFDIRLLSVTEDNRTCDESKLCIEFTLAINVWSLIIEEDTYSTCSVAMSSKSVLKMTEMLFP